MNTTIDFVLSGLDSAVADELRVRGGLAYVADEHPGFPCRQCLRDAEIGEELILTSYDPFHGSSPYRSASPIFLHTDACRRDDSADLPEQLTRRRLSVRAFDENEMMVDAALIDGSDLGATIEAFLRNDAVERLHIHNEPRGCYAARIDRAR